MSDPTRTVEAVWRIECARVVGAIARVVGDVGQAEEFAQDALVAALEQWPARGVPDNPGAWLVTIAKRRAIDHIRRQQTYQRKLTEIGRGQQEEYEETGEVDTIEDDILRLMFVSCHPTLTMDSRVALTLKVVGGLRTDEIGRAFLVPEATVAQRIVRAKRTLADAHVPFEVPGKAERADRLAAVLEAIYLIFNEGYAATTGGDWMRPELCDEATRLGRILAGLMPTEPEVHGLVALMELQASRANARTDRNGEPIRLLDQDRSRWNQLLIRRGLAALARGEEAAGDKRGPYLVQASIAACHARARTAGDTDWVRIAIHYRELIEIDPSPIVELNRAVAVAMAFGPQAGLDIVDTLTGNPQLKDYHLLPSVRGDLLARLGRSDEASAEFTRAAGMTRNDRERALLEARAKDPQP
ncbi:RNA polymerase sigma factor [Virgisporangium ochraceum]|uniref:RNA polymerase sigma factor n=1 Tax=Virgisporangium ochraceum TaxID=65505 RepID=A0A8J3ZQ61_9ACTN|nr:RNA polymerase sigma factor [Virgisporangium ochraceum]GIJ65525.1 RNA polymerase sigma factor [Virgisporangium ochraceum]